jgi:hypothetical protein
MDATEQKTLAQMTAEVVENNTAKGWYENCATFSEAMALLHSEVSEALEAWRRWGLDDATLGEWHNERFIEKSGKPEGVGSEFADIFIRLLDDAWLFGQVDLEAAAVFWPVPEVSISFPANMNALHDLISRASTDAGSAGKYVHALGAVLVFLRQLCEEYSIDLLAEYERKMTYNRSRPYRHGGKRI